MPYLNLTQEEYDKRRKKRKNYEWLDPTVEDQDYYQALEESDQSE